MGGVYLVVKALATLRALEPNVGRGSVGGPMRSGESSMLPVVV